MQIFLRCLSATVALLVWCVMPAQGAEQPETVAAIARLMDEQAIAVARVDNTRVSPETMAGFFSALLASSKEIPSPEQAEDFVRRYREEIGPQSYLIISVPGSNRLPVIWANPVNDPARAPKQATVVDGIAVAGDERLVARALAAREAALAEKGAPGVRANLAAALAAVADAPLALVAVPSADQQRVFREITPDLPAEFGASHLRELLRAIDWVAIGYDEGHSLRVVLNTSSEPAATDAVAHLEELLKIVASAGASSSAKQLGLPLQQLVTLASALKPRPSGNQVVLELDGAQLAAALQPALAAAAKVADRRTAMNSLKQVALAMHNFHEAIKDKEGKHYFPDTASFDAQGKPLLSWRVHVLPFLEQDALYREFHLDEPWDSEHNKKLIERMPDVFRLPGTKVEKGKTTLVLPVGEGAAFNGTRLSIREITDGLSNTILAVVVDDEHAVTWTAPDDLRFDNEHPAAGLGQQYGDGFLVMIADGSVHFLPASIAIEQLRAYFSPKGGEVIERR